MANIFAITTANDRLQLGANGQAEAVFTVTNITGRPLRGIAKLKPQGDTKREWLTLVGESERDLAAGGSSQFSVAIKAAPATPPGKYGFRIDVVSVVNPDEDFTEGPIVTAEALPPKPPAPSRLWIIPVALIALLVIGTVVILVVRRKPTDNLNALPPASPIPTVSPKSSSSPKLPPSDGRVIELTEGTYEQEVVKSQMPVLVHFEAPWSGPSRQLMPTVQTIAREYGGRVKVGEVNVDESPELARRVTITSIPTLIIVRNGHEQQRLTGAVPKETITRLLDQQLVSNP